MSTVWFLLFASSLLGIIFSNTNTKRSGFAFVALLCVIWDIGRYYGYV